MGDCKVSNRIPEGLKKPITTIAEAMAWIDLLVSSKMDFHLEDSAASIGYMEGPNRQWVDLFTKADARIVDVRRHELYALDFEWGTYDCPIGYMMAKLDERDGTTDLQ